MALLKIIYGILAFWFALGAFFVALGVGHFCWKWASIHNPVIVTGTVIMAEKFTTSDGEGQVAEDLMFVTFPIADGTTVKHEGRIGSRFFFSAGDPVRVRYNAADPKQAMILGFFAEPAEGSFMILFGASWIAFPMFMALFMDRVQLKALREGFFIMWKVAREERKARRARADKQDE